MSDNKVFEDISCNTFRTEDSKLTVLKLKLRTGGINTIVFDPLKITSVVLLTEQVDSTCEELFNYFSNETNYKYLATEDLKSFLEQDKLVDISETEAYFCAPVTDEATYEDFITTLHKLNDIPPNCHIVCLLPVKYVDIDVLSNLIYHSSSLMSKDRDCPSVHFITVGDHSIMKNKSYEVLNDLFTFQFIIDMDDSTVTPSKAVYSRQVLEEVKG